MNFQEGSFIATSMIAFSTSFGVLIALLGWLYQIKKLSLLELFLYSVMYINANLLVLYILKRAVEEDEKKQN